MKYFLKLLLLLVLPMYTNAVEIHQTTFAYWNKPDVEIYYITPDGTTGLPKGVMLTHDNVVFTVLNMSELTSSGPSFVSRATQVSSSI